MNPVVDQEDEDHGDLLRQLGLGRMVSGGSGGDGAAGGFDGPMPEDGPAHEGDRECVVCMENRVCSVLVPCGHLVMCSACTQQVVREARDRGQEPKCPVCRRQTTGAVGVY